MIGVLLTGGKGLRAYPTTKYIPKPLFKIAGKTLLQRNVEILKNQLNVTELIIIVGHLKEKILKHFDENDYGIQVTFIEQLEQKGIGHALLQAEDKLMGKNFTVMLGDEFYHDSDHNSLLELFNNKKSPIIAFREENNSETIKKNYTGIFDDNIILSLQEKPSNPNTNIMGLGTYILNDKIFKYIKSTDPSNIRKEVEITDVISNMAQNEKVYYKLLKGYYYNITNRQDLFNVNYYLRNNNFLKYKISVVIPAYNEEESIGHVIKDYLNHESVNEVLVIDNNSTDATFNIANDLGVRVIKEGNQGYGCAMKRGIEEARGDIIILTEADGSFWAQDVGKFLVYLKECDMVIGTRTTRQMNEQGSNMNFETRWANVLLAKILEMLWWRDDPTVTPRFTDVGCTYRAIWKDSAKDIMNLLTVAGPEFSVQMMLAMLIAHQKIIEIPVSYHKRIGGESKHSINFFAKAKTAFKMLFLTIKYRLLMIKY